MLLIMLVVKNTVNNIMYTVQEAHSFDEIVFQVSLYSLQ